MQDVFVRALKAFRRTTPPAHVPATLEETEELLRGHRDEPHEEHAPRCQAVLATGTRHVEESLDSHEIRNASRVLVRLESAFPLAKAA